MLSVLHDNTTKTSHGQRTIHLLFMFVLEGRWERRDNQGARRQPLTFARRQGALDRNRDVHASVPLEEHPTESIMKTLAYAAAALFIGTAAFAQDTTTTIKKEEGVLGDKTTIEKRTEPSTSTSTSVTTTGSVGCSTETKQKTDAVGDTTTTKKTEC
jgi:hypothetical protein